jgi:bacterioferritin-associated ferredoxin
MYVCNCNGITEREVRIAVQNGAQHWSDVHAHHDCEPCCGRCEGEITDVINEGCCARKKHTGPIFGAPALATG